MVNVAFWYHHTPETKGGAILDNTASLIRWQNSKCATSGFLTGLGGLITLPVAVRRAYLANYPTFSSNQGRFDNVKFIDAAIGMDEKSSIKGSK